MYTEFYGLTDDPFQLGCDRRFCFIHPSYAKAKAYMQFALHRAEGFIMITGRPGTGKTMLIQDIIAIINPAQIKVAHLVSVQLHPDDLLRMTAFAFGIDAHTSHKASVLQRLTEFLLQHAQQGRRALLIIDEAQDIIPSALEELRLLTNIQYEGRSILQIFLIGQETLRDIIRSADMEQVHQRLVAAWHLQPLTRSEIIGYVRHRLETAGWRGNPAFKPGIFPVIYQFSQGIPRRINLICSRLLLQGFINESYMLTAADATTVFTELQQEELTTPNQSDDEALLSADTTKTNSSQPIKQPTRHYPDWTQLDQGLMIDTLHSPTLEELLTTTVTAPTPSKVETTYSPTHTALSHETVPVHSFKADQIDLLTASIAPPTQTNRLEQDSYDNTTVAQFHSKPFVQFILDWLRQHSWLRWLLMIVLGLLLFTIITLLAIFQPAGVKNLLMALRTALLFQ